MAITLSVLSGNFRFGLKKNIYSIYKGSTAFFSKMSEWQTEKEKFLSMSVEEKRNHYAKKTFYTIDKIPTWKEFAKNSKNLPEIIPLLTTNTIDSTLNAKLADKISIFSGDITTLEIDVIVNAANKALRGGGGVDGAIHRAAGHSLLQKECQTLNGCPEGEAKLTGGYRLPARYIIHTVGPQGEKPGLLQACYRNSIEVMLEKKFRTIAFPCISTGIYGYPLQPAAHVAVMEVRRQLEKNHDKIDRVIFCLFGEADEQIYQGILQSYFPLT